MEFGKADLSELEAIDYSLPADPPSTKNYLSENQGKYITKVYAGCSKWGQQEWVGQVYPEGTSEKDFLTQYIEKYECLELDTTFYNIQRKNVWKLIEAVKGKPFKVCPKFNRRISHSKNFEEVKDLTAYFVNLMNEFGENLGSCILQFPEYFAVKRLSDLEYLLNSLPSGFPVSVELRNKGWFYGDGPEIFQLLRDREIGVAITATAGRRDVIHMQITNPVVIIRFVGNDLHSTDLHRMDLWVDRINEWRQSGALKEIYFFVHHDDERHSPATVSYFAHKLKAVSGIELKVPGVM